MNELDNYVKEEHEAPIGIRLALSKGHSQPYYHYHPHYEMIFVESGNFRCESNTKIIISDRPSIIIHRPYCLHRLYADNSLLYRREIISISRYALMRFQSDLVDMSLFAKASVMVAYPNDYELSELRILCGLLHNATENGYDLVKASLYSAAVLHITIEILKNGRGDSFVTEQSYIQDALQYVGENPSEELTVQGLADKFGVGKTKFAYDFKKLTGKSFKKYLTDMRMILARELLKSGHSIIATSFETGYSSESHFIKAFREYYGITPGKVVNIKIDDIR